MARSAPPLAVRHCLNKEKKGWVGLCSYVSATGTSAEFAKRGSGRIETAPHYAKESPTAGTLRCDPCLAQAQLLVGEPAVPPALFFTRAGEWILVALQCTKCGLRSTDGSVFGLRRDKTGRLRTNPQCRACRGKAKPDVEPV